MDDDDIEEEDDSNYDYEDIIEKKAMQDIEKILFKDVDDFDEFDKDEEDDDN